MSRTMTDQLPVRTADSAAAPPLPRSPEGGHRRPRAGIVPVLAFAGIVVAVMQTLLVPVVKDLPTLLGTAPSNAMWVMTATLLAGAVATPIMGRLGDLYGKRRMLLASLGIMVVGSLVCGFTGQLIVMIVGRALQGFAMGAIPLGIGLMRDALPRERLGSAMALMSSSIGVGGGLALPFAALVAQHTDWHALFFTSAGLGVLSMLLTLLVVPESPVRAPGRFDVVGALGLSAGLVALLLPITKGSDWGWGSPLVLGLFGAAAVILVLWGLMELRIADPLVDLRTSARREVLLTNLASITVGVAFYAISLVLPQLLQLPTSTGYGLGQSMVVAGLCVAPLGLTMMFVAPLYARIAARRGPKISLLLGMLVIGIGYGGGLGLMRAPWQTVIIAMVVGAGIGLAYSSLPALIVGAVDPSETGAANGLNTLMRSIGTSVSSAVIGMVLAHMSEPLGPVEVPTMAGFRVSFLIATAAVALGVLVAAFLPSQRKAAAAREATAGRAASAARHAQGAEQGAAGAGSRDGAADAGGGVRAVAGSEDAVRKGGAADRETDQATAAPALLPEAPAAPGFRGRVVDAAGGPVPGATVTLIDRHGRQAGVTTTAADGGYALTAPAAGIYVLTGAAPGHTPQAVSATCAGEAAVAEAQLVLTPTGSRLAGTLLGGPDGAALAGASVVVTDARGDVVTRTTTDADGRWTIAQLPDGDHTLVLSAPGHQPEARAVQLTGGGAGVDRRSEGLHEVRLRPTATVRGTVRGPDGRPLAEAAVTLLEDGAVAGRMVTGPDGAYAFTDLTSRQYTLSVAGYPPHAAPISLARGADARLDLDVAQPGGATVR
ncbi:MULTISPECIES: MFS transporter [unclassified Streptomyces]|uniref:MFS transporter n=1 Tax=unclassified Streptomyces TaxID=2593676 RepID=UPI0003733EC4|nr:MULTISPECIES: MFS transporter [unclassified Streptomyces]MYT27766.1 MFS transporter [Streptomyces sp. SID8354]